ncbi:MAG: PilZ domain-containing protein [Acidobacteria bacterium]|nr:PilZ domain-containing protein [Acidobacteriota bacterium]
MPKSQGRSKKRDYHRRSSRALVRLPLIVAAKDDGGNVSFHSAETEVVSQHGALIRSESALSVGDTLEITWRNKNRSAEARVVWVKTSKRKGEFEVGIEFVGEERFWEMKFVPDRKREQKPPPRNRGKA